MKQVGEASTVTDTRARKSALRKRLRRQRNALSEEQQTQAAVQLVEQLKTMPIFQRSQSIALYFANDGEIDPGQVLAWSLAHGKRCYTPVMMRPSPATVQQNTMPQAHQNRLRFAEITAHSSFQNNHFGIAEPVVAAHEFVEGSEIELMLLPLVGFDRYGNRIGMGGGFYDATLAFKKANPQQPPQLLGLAHEMQRVEEIAAENWDIPLSAVVTEQRIYHCTPVQSCANA